RCGFAAAGLRFAKDKLSRRLITKNDPGVWPHRGGACTLLRVIVGNTPPAGPECGSRPSAASATHRRSCGSSRTVRKSILATAASARKREPAYATSLTGRVRGLTDGAARCGRLDAVRHVEHAAQQPDGLLRGRQ